MPPTPAPRNYSTPDKPTPLRVIPENIPAELTRLHHWVLWRYEFRNNKWTKPPYQLNGAKASSTDDQTWADFEAVFEAYQAGAFDGIGFVLSEGVGIVGIDLDHCAGTEFSDANATALRIVTSLRSYSEFSPSGEGIRVLVSGNLPPGKRKKGNFEVYAKERYLTITGHHIEGTPENIEER